MDFFYPLIKCLEIRLQLDWLIQQLNKSSETKRLSIPLINVITVCFYSSKMVKAVPGKQAVPSYTSVFIKKENLSLKVPFTFL